MERTYALTDNPADEKLGKPAQGPPTKEELRRMLPALLISLIGEVERYLAEDEADPARDGLGVSAATLFMNDAEWRAFGEKLSALVMEAAALPPGEGRRQRRLTTILDAGGHGAPGRRGEVERRAALERIDPMLTISRFSRPTRAAAEPWTICP